MKKFFSIGLLLICSSLVFTGQNPVAINSGISVTNAAITPNGPNVLYEYEVTGINLLATGASSFFTTATGLGRFHPTFSSVEITSITGSQPAGTLTVRIGTVGNSYLEFGVIGATATNFAEETVQVGTFISNVPPADQTGSAIITLGGLSIPQTTAISVNVSTAFTTSTTLVGTARVWGFYK